MKALRIYKKYGMYILLVIEILIFAVAAPNFLSVNNLLMFCGRYPCWELPHAD